MCSITWCGRSPDKKQSPCRVHKRRYRTRCDPHEPIDPNLAQRFWRKANTGDADGCWVWTSTTIHSGYGRIKDGGRYRLAHRVAYELHHGEVSDDLYVCHHCDNPPCVNPSHLFLGTQSENMKDAVRKGRVSPPHGPNGGSFEDGNTPTNRLLRDSEALLVKHLLHHSSLTHEKVAMMFRISRQTVADISCGRSYVNVEYSGGELESTAPTSFTAK